LNGFYLVKTTDANINTPIKDGITKLEAISCAFRHQEGAAFRQPHNILENRVGGLKLFGRKSLNGGAVHFRVRSESVHTRSNTFVIPFSKIILNMGGGHYDGAKGVFTVPKMGIYQINFSGMFKSHIADQKRSIYIQLKINDRISPDFTSCSLLEEVHE